MQLVKLVVVAGGLLPLWTVSARADEAKAKEALMKAIEAHGGEAELKKMESSSMRMKGAVHVMGMEIAFTGDTASVGLDKRRIDLEMEIMNQKIRVTNIFAKNKGWIKINDDVKEMNKDQIDEAKDQSHSQWVANLLPVKGKGYSVSTVGEDKVNNTPVIVIRVEHKGQRDVNLSFDKKTFLLLKTESRIKDENGQEVNEEAFYSEYNEKGLRQPKKITVKRDGKLFIEAEIEELKTEVKFDDKHFDKP